jgi:hypothetical protein
LQSQLASQTHPMGASLGETSNELAVAGFFVGV